MKEDCVWAKAGHIVATEQFLLKKGTVLKNVPSAVSLSFNKTDIFNVVREREGVLYFRRPNVEVSFDEKAGKLIGLKYNGRNMIQHREGWTLNWYRSINNDPRSWQHSEAKLCTFDWKWAEDRQSIIIASEVEVAVGKIKVPYTIVYHLYGDGQIQVNASFKTSPDFNLPRLTLQGFFNPALENIEWYGRGPIENYQDRKNAAFIGRYKTNVTEMAEHYLRTQTMGGRSDTHWLTLTDIQGKGMKITSIDKTFDFSALHYTDKDLWETKYSHNLSDIYRSEIVINIDCVQRGLGNASCGPGPRPQYEIKPNMVYEYSFWMEPLE